MALAQAMADLRTVPDRLVKREEMAGMLGVSVPTFYRMRKDGEAQGKPCPEVTWGRRLLRFRPSEVQRWADSVFQNGSVA